ncbi:MAG: ankyrin repeat domain-containing protein [Gammaproteobacteria bacterium]|nr:ankyrin repeat domain-containing protein [Gammaproteobacteria bacterium]
MGFNSVEKVLNQAILEGDLPIFQHNLATMSDPAFKGSTDRLRIHINATDEAGNTFLHYAAKVDSSEFLTILLKQKDIQPDIENLKGETPLYRAISNKHFENAKLLKDQDADLSTQDNDGKTLLHVAAEKDDPIICEWLLINGVDPDVSTISSGKTPLDVAIANKCKPVIELLSLFGCLSGKLISKELFTLDLDLAYHFVVGSFYKIPHRNGEATELVSRDDRNCGAAITDLEQFQRAKHLLNTIKSRRFKNSEEEYTAYKLLLSTLTFNWQFWLQLHQYDRTPLFLLYDRLRKLNQDSQDYRTVIELIEHTEQIIAKREIKVSIYSLPIEKLIQKIDQADKIYYSPAMVSFLKVLRLHQPSRLKMLIVNKIQERYEDPNWSQVRQAITAGKTTIPQDILDLIGDLSGKNMPNFKAELSEINFAIYYLNKVGETLNAFENDLNQTKLVNPREVTIILLIALVLLSSLGILVLVWGVTADFEDDIRRILGISGGSTLIITTSLATIGLSIDLFYNITTSIPLNTPSIRILTSAYHALKITNMLGTHQAALKNIITLFEDMLYNMNTENAYAKSILEKLELLRNPQLKVKEMISIIHNLHHEVTSISSDLKDSPVQSNKLNHSKEIINFRSYHHGVSFFPLKLGSLVERLEKNRDNFNTCFKQLVSIPDHQEEFAVQEHENNNNDCEEEPLIIKIR